MSEDDTIMIGAFTPDGRQIVTGSNGGKLERWSAENGLKIDTLSKFTNRICDIEFSSDGNVMIVSSFDGNVRTFNAKENQVSNFVIPQGFIEAASISSDGRKVIAGANGVALVCTLDGDVLAILEDHSASLVCVSFSSDGAGIVTVCGDGSVRVWTRRRPESIFGVLVLPEVWVLIVLCVVQLALFLRRAKT